MIKEIIKGRNPFLEETFGSNPLNGGKGWSCNLIIGYHQILREIRVTQSYCLFLFHRSQGLMHS